MSKDKKSKNKVVKGRDYRTSKRRDGLRKAKKFGYRFSGDSIRTPTHAEIQQMHDGKRDDIYYEGRVERADVSTNAKRGERFENGGSVDENYFKIINHFVYFCFNYPDNFLDAWGIDGVGTMREQIKQKFDSAYEKAGATGAIIKFWTDLDSSNRRIFADWIKNNYDGGYKYEHEGSVGAVINHFVFFTLNYPQNFVDAFGDLTKEQMRSKFDADYQRYGSYGAMVKFWSELDAENKEIFAKWIRENYKGNKLTEYSKGSEIKNSDNNSVINANNTVSVPVHTPESIITPPIEVVNTIPVMTHDRELSCEEVEEKIGRHLSKWNMADDKVLIEGIVYKKCYMRKFYKPLK